MGNFSQLFLLFFLIFLTIAVFVTCIWKIIKLIATYKMERRIEELQSTPDFEESVVSPKDLKTIRRLSILSGAYKKWSRSPSGRSSLSVNPCDSIQGNGGIGANQLSPFVLTPPLSHHHTNHQNGEKSNNGNSINANATNTNTSTLNRSSHHTSTLHRNDRDRDPQTSQLLSPNVSSRPRLFSRSNSTIHLLPKSFKQLSQRSASFLSVTPKLLQTVKDASNLNATTQMKSATTSTADNNGAPRLSSVDSSGLNNPTDDHLPEQTPPPPASQCAGLGPGPSVGHAPMSCAVHGGHHVGAPSSSTSSAPSSQLLHSNYHQQCHVHYSALPPLSPHRFNMAQQQAQACLWRQLGNATHHHHDHLYVAPTIPPLLPTSHTTPTPTLISCPPSVTPTPSGQVSVSVQVPSSHSSESSACPACGGRSKKDGRASSGPIRQSTPIPFRDASIENASDTDEDEDDDDVLGDDDEMSSPPMSAPPIQINSYSSYLTQSRNMNRYSNDISSNDISLREPIYSTKTLPRIQCPKTTNTELE